MNMLINATESKTMSSREIAELTGKRHDHVMVDISKMMIDLNLNAPDFSGTYKTDQGNEYPCFHLPKRETLILVSGYSVAMRASIIDRWQELEGQKIQTPVELSRLEILQMAIETEKANIQLTSQLAIAAPKVDYYDKVVTRENLLNATQIAQKLKLSAVKMNKILEELGVYNNSVKSSRAFKQWFVDKGFGLIRQTELGYPQAMFTLQGEAWVIERLVSEGAV